MSEARPGCGKTATFGADPASSVDHDLLFEAVRADVTHVMARLGGEIGQHLLDIRLVRTKPRAEDGHLFGLRRTGCQRDGRNPGKKRLFHV